MRYMNEYGWITFFAENLVYMVIVKFFNAITRELFWIQILTPPALKGSHKIPPYKMS